MQNYYAVIPAAGQGKRMKAGKNKQFLTINDTPLLIHTVRVFEEDSLCTGIVLAVNKNEKGDVADLLAAHHITKVIHIVEGGKERQQSVYEGLKAIGGNPVVLIHDGARPFIRKEKIHELVASTAEKGAAVVAVPVKDTVKLVDKGQITQTVDRTSLWAVQTPQAFYLEEITYAHQTAEKDGFTGTDDASLMEYLNRPVATVEGDYENLKITTPEDLLFAEAIFKRREEDIQQ